MLPTRGIPGFKNWPFEQLPRDDLIKRYQDDSPHRLVAISKIAGASGRGAAGSSRGVAEAILGFAGLSRTNVGVVMVRLEAVNPSP